MFTHLELSKSTGLTMAELEAGQRVLSRIMSTCHVPPGEAARTLLSMAAVNDQRVATWSVRLRVFDGLDALIADSDDGADHDAEGEAVVRGVSGAYIWACELIAAFQPAVDANALMEAFDRRSPTLRVAVSRGGGKGHIAAPYIVNGDAFAARLDFQRKNDPA